MAKHNKIPNFEEQTQEGLDHIRESIKKYDILTSGQKTFVLAAIDCALWFPHFLQNSNITMKKLRIMIFGKGYQTKEQADKIKYPLTSTTSHPDLASLALLNTTAEIEAEVNKNTLKPLVGELLPKEPPAAKPGHGRMPHSVYTNATIIEFKITNFKPGMPCFEALCTGKLYEFEPRMPKTIVRIEGQSIASAVKYVVQRIRCNLCSAIFNADIPPHVGTQKYDAKFKALLIVNRYLMAMPLYRLEKMFAMLDCPLSDATMWDLLKQTVSACLPIYEYLKIMAANNKSLHIDDTPVRILEFIQTIKNDPAIKRKGMYTTCIVSDTAAGQQICLFISGIQHAGENLTDILALRSPDAEPIIQMSDASSMNIAKEIEAIVCNCMSHGFRKFKEIMEFFPTQCVTIMRLLSHVYQNEEHALSENMTDEKKQAYHQENTKPYIETLKTYLEKLLSEKNVEPNNQLGKSIKYMLNNWDKLTRFLSVAGAPICNNIVERALKLAIRSRKSSMFYRTLYSAKIGSVYTSLVGTCLANNANSINYFTALQINAGAVHKNPELWLPWNFNDNLNNPLDAAVPASSAVFVPNKDCPAEVLSAAQLHAAH